MIRNEGAMDRRGILGLMAGGAIAAPELVSSARAAEASAGHRVALQVSANDEGVMNLALNNASNLAEYYSARKEPVAIEIVAYGPGLHMLRQDTSPVKEHLAAVMSAVPAVVLSACNNTKRRMEKAEGKEIALLPGVRIVPAGVVRLIELQEQGWSYIRP
jgi:uncharacterized protein